MTSDWPLERFLKLGRYLHTISCIFTLVGILLFKNSSNGFLGCIGVIPKPADFHSNKILCIMYTLLTLQKCKLQQTNYYFYLQYTELFPK